MQQTASVEVVRKNPLPRFHVEDVEGDVFVVKDRKEDRIIAECDYETDAKRIAAGFNMLHETFSTLHGANYNMDVILGIQIFNQNKDLDEQRETK